MAFFIISNLEANDFVFEGISFKKASDEEKCKWGKDYNMTFKALAKDNLATNPIIHFDGLISVVNDICTLLSLAQSRKIYCPMYEIGGTSILRDVIPDMSFGRSSRPVKPENDIEAYLRTAAVTLRKEEGGWAKSVGFIPSVYFLLESMEGQVLDIKFTAAWIALKILANSHVGKSEVLAAPKFEIVKQLVCNALDNEMKEGNLTNENKKLIQKRVPELNRFSIAEKVKSLREAHGWGSVTDEFVGKCNKLRNSILHSGTYRDLEKEQANQLYLQLANTVQLMLINLLGYSQFSKVRLQSGD